MIYSNSFEYIDPLNILFLCGNKYSKDDCREKRNVLKKFLELNIPDCSVIILEEHFVFGKTNMNYLAYDDVFLDGLSQVEELASLFANKIIIIHETISTAAELGMFAINPDLAKKICVLVPDDISIDERKITSFIQLAFNNNNVPDTKIGQKIFYYPDVEINRISPEKSFYYTYFHNNEIGYNLGRSIITFVGDKPIKNNLRIIKCLFDKPDKNANVLNYSIDKQKNVINIYVHTDILKIQLLAIFFIEDNKHLLRTVKDIKEHVTYICEEYESIILKTIAKIEGIDETEYSLKTMLKGSKSVKLRQAVGYYLYMLQAIGLIKLEQTEKMQPSKRRIRISAKMNRLKKELDGLIITEHTSAFGRLR